MGEGSAANAQSTVSLVAKIPLSVTRTATSYRPPRTSQPKLPSHPVSSPPPPPQAAPPKPGVVSIPPPHIAVLSYPKCPRSSAASLAHLQTTHRTSGLYCAARNGWIDRVVGSPSPSRGHAARLRFGEDERRETECWVRIWYVL